MRWTKWAGLRDNKTQLGDRRVREWCDERKGQAYDNKTQLGDRRVREWCDERKGQAYEITNTTGRSESSRMMRWTKEIKKHTTWRSESSRMSYQWTHTLLEGDCSGMDTWEGGETHVQQHYTTGENKRKSKANSYGNYTGGVIWEWMWGRIMLWANSIFSK